MLVIDTQAMYGINHDMDMNYSVKHLAEARAAHKSNYDIKFLIMPVSVKDNNSVADVVKKNSSFILGAYLQIVPKPGLPWGYTSPADLRGLAKRPEIKGLKLVTSLVKTSLDDKVLDDYVKIAIDLDKVLLVHCSTDGDDYTSMDKKIRFAKKHPRLKIEGFD